MPIPAIIGALGALASGVAGGILSNNAAREAQLRSISAQRGLQNMLLNSGGQLARSAKQAGLSPAFALGNSSVTAASAPASNYAPYNFDSSSLNSLLGGISQRKLQSQQAKQVSEETKLAEENTKIATEKRKQEEIITEKMLGRKNAANDYGTVYIDPDTKKIIPDLNSTNYNEWVSSHPEIKSHPIPLVPYGYEGQLDFDNWLAEYETQNSERSSRQSKAMFDKALNDAKLSQSDYIDILLSMDREQLNDIRATIRNKGLQAAYQKLLNKQTEDSSMGHLLDKLGNPDMNWFDKLMAVIAWLGNNISLSARIK